MVSDHELAHYVESLVRQTASLGGSAISADAVVRQLEEQLHVDLTPKTQLVCDILVALLGPAHGPEPPSRNDPFEAAAGAGSAAPPHPPFSASAAASASTPPPAPAVPNFFPQQMPSGMASFLSAGGQFPQHRPGAPAPPFDIPAPYRYTPQISDARRAGVAYLHQMQEARQYSQHFEQQRQQQQPAATAAAATVTTSVESSPRAPAASAGSKKDR
jgi:upstream activation factor subunit UAF30